MALIAGFLVAVLATPVAARVARRLGVVDRPGPLKVHEQPVPYLGGLAVLVALVGPLALGRPTLLIPLALATLLGLADDVSTLTPRLRLACEMVVGVSAVLVLPTRGPVGAVVTVVAVLALVNAVNLLDGLDGLASGVGAMSAIGFGLALHGDVRVLGLGLAGGLLGFLVWNRPPAGIYLGDAGSYLVGTALALLVAHAFGPGQPIGLASGSALFVAVPVADTAIAIVRRQRAGRPLLQGDRGHVYDQLRDRGWSATRASGSCVGAQLLLVAIGLGINELPGPVAAAAASVVVVTIGTALIWFFTSPATWA